MRGMNIAKGTTLAATAAGLLVLGTARAQDAAAGGSPGGDSAGRITVLELLQKGGPLMYPLYVCSLLTVAFGIERAISLRRRRVLPPVLVQHVLEVMGDPGHALYGGALLEEIESEPCPLARVLAAGLRKAGRTEADIEKAIQYAGEREIWLLRRNGRVLSVVASVAPLLGLLGTVFGMIQAFITVASREEALGRTELLAAGIYQALVTTAVGLCIAIPALVLYHIFTEKIDRLVAEMDDIATQLVDRLSAPADLEPGE